MDDIRFEWDERKNKLNQKKHRISFEEAQTVFFDEHAVEFFDPDHSEGEDRFCRSDYLGQESNAKRARLL